MSGVWTYRYVFFLEASTVPDIMAPLGLVYPRFTVASMWAGSFVPDMLILSLSVIVENRSTVLVILLGMAP